MITSTTPGEFYNHPLFEQTFYGRTTIRGAGFKKYIVIGITTNFYTNNKIVVLSCTWKNKIRYADMKLQDNILEPIDKVYFSNLSDYFIFMESSEALYKRFIKSSKQYKLEFYQIKQKYPERFL